MGSCKSEHVPMKTTTIMTAYYETGKMQSWRNIIEVYRICRRHGTYRKYRSRVTVASQHNCNDTGIMWGETKNVI